MDDLQVLQNKAACIILDLPPHTSSCDAQVKTTTMYCTEELSTVPLIFVYQSILITFFLVPLNFVLMVIFMHDYTQPKEGGAIALVSTLLQMSGIPLIHHLGKPLLYPVLNKTCPK